MKLVTLALIACVSAGPVYAADEDNTPANELRQMAECQAVDMSLMQMYNSLAAAIDVLSPNGPTSLHMLRDSYRMLAQVEEAKVREMIALTRNALLPNMDPAVSDHYVEEVGKLVAGIQKALNLAPYDKQRQVQDRLLTTASECETFTQHLTGNTTY